MLPAINRENVYFTLGLIVLLATNVRVLLGIEFMDRDTSYTRALQQYLDSLQRPKDYGKD